jgi:hypothetical protein
MSKEFKTLQKQLFDAKMSEEEMRTEITDLFAVHDELFRLTKPKQHGYNWRNNKKSFTLQASRKKLFSIPKEPTEVKA